MCKCRVFRGFFIYPQSISCRRIFFHACFYEKILRNGGFLCQFPKKSTISLADLPACPVETTLTLISDKWKVLILRDLMPGTKRFGELKKSIGHVSQKVLTSQLRQMEQSGLVSRKVYAEVPPRVEYTLTDLGYSLQPIMDAMWSWGENYKKKLSAEESETA